MYGHLGKRQTGSIDVLTVGCCWLV